MLEYSYVRPYLGHSAATVYINPEQEITGLSNDNAWLRNVNKQKARIHIVIMILWAIRSSVPSTVSGEEFVFYASNLHQIAHSLMINGVSKNPFRQVGDL